jgi:pimeloyl-ACP methyl ester carboxylesterase
MTEHVVLLHGLARTKRSLNKIAKSLKASGYQTHQLGYPSTRYSIEHLVNYHLAPFINALPNDETIHFVTHSMGGILVRQYLRTQSLPQLGRVVMLAPPNQGSEIVDAIAHWPLFKWVNGPAGQQLGTQGLPSRLPSADFHLGIIAGTRFIKSWTNRFMPSPHDGKVSVESTKLEGMHDHLSLPVNHTFMMNYQIVVKQVKHFIQLGQFQKAI